MDSRQFAEGYTTPALHAFPEALGEVNPEVTSLMEGPRKWTSYFDTQLFNYLKGEPLDAPEDIDRELELEYSTEWGRPHLYDTVMDIRKLGYDDMDAQRAANELHFHVMNRELLPMWHRLLLPEFREEFTVDELYRMQLNLSIHASEISKTSKQARSEDLRRGITTGMVGVFNGQLTEIDTAIVILEQMKRDALIGESRLVLLPAPQKFEAGYRNKRRSIDFILIDPEEKQARGIQVKTRVSSLNEDPLDRPFYKPKTSQAPVRRYDPEYVTLVDGFTDLGNSRVTADRRRVEAAPGLVSLDFLQHNVSIQKLSKDPAFRDNIKAIMQAKWIAKELAGDRTSYLNFATTHVFERILHDLYQGKEKTPE